MKPPSRNVADNGNLFPTGFQAFVSILSKQFRKKNELIINFLALHFAHNVECKLN